MLSVVLALLVCVVLALAVLALVAVPARRAGRDVLTDRGEEVVGSIRDRRLPPGRSGRARHGAHAAAPDRAPEPVGTRG